MTLNQFAVVSGAVASVVAVLGAILALALWIRRAVVNRRPLVITTRPNHTYTQKDGTIILGMHLDIDNPSHKNRSINQIQLSAEPSDTLVRIAAVDWTEPGMARIDLDSPERPTRHVTPAEDVLKFPLSIPGEDRVGGLIFLHLKPSPDANEIVLTIALLDGRNELGSIVQRLTAISAK